VQRMRVLASGFTVRPEGGFSRHAPIGSWGSRHDPVMLDRPFQQEPPGQPWTSARWGDAYDADEDLVVVDGIDHAVLASPCPSGPPKRVICTARM
jgi:hypothetical protein